MRTQGEFEKHFNDAKKFFKANGFVIDDRKLRGILATIEERIPVLAVGPTGSGKTLFFELLAKFLKGEYRYQSLNGSITIHDLTQERILGKNGQFEERDMILAEWLRASQKETSILQLDEVNAAKSETLLALHAVMDLKGQLYLPYTKEILKVSERTILVMSCNEGDEYSGINALNMAFKNRYVTFHFPYIQGTVLAELLTTVTSVPQTETTKIVQLWEKYMSSKDPEQPVVGIRMLMYWCRLTKYLGIRDAGIYTFAGLVAKDEDELVEIVEGDMFVNLPR